MAHKNHANHHFFSPKNITQLYDKPISGHTPPWKGNRMPIATSAGQITTIELLVLMQ